MSNDKMSPEMQIAIRRSPDYTAPSAELAALRAEVAAWRRAVRWEGANHVYTLYVTGVGERSAPLGKVWCRGDGWIIFDQDRTLYPDRNTACTKVCELLGLPVVLPGGE